MKARYSCGTCGKEETISGVEMVQIEHWHNLVACTHTKKQVQHGVNANFGYYPVDQEDAQELRDVGNSDD